MLFLLEVKDSIASQTSLNSPVDTGGLSRNFLTDSFVDKSEKTAYIGSSLKETPRRIETLGLKKLKIRL